MDNNEILDTAENKKDNNLLLLNNLDYGINLFGLVVATTLGIVSIFANFALMYLAISLFFLGVYQLISALVGSLRGNRQKRNYLILAVAYLIFLWLGSLSGNNVFSSELETVILVVFILVLPLFGAVYYTYLCYEAKNQI